MRKASKVLWGIPNFLSVDSFLSVSLSAVNLINNLLQVVLRRRFSVGKAMGHPWFQVWGLVQKSTQPKHIVLHAHAYYCRWMHSVIDAQLVCFSRCRTSRRGVTCVSLSSGWDVAIWRTRRMTSAGEPTLWRKTSLSHNIQQQQLNRPQTLRHKYDCQYCIISEAVFISKYVVCFNIWHFSIK